MYFFNKFPTTTYDVSNDGNLRNVKNIIRRFKTVNIIRSRRIRIFEHLVAEGDRPEHVANLWYGDPTLDWLILLSNEIYDSQFEWTMDYYTFRNYMIEKYGSVEDAKTTVHHYEKKVRDQTIDIDGLVHEELYLRVDLATYNATPAVDRRSITQWEYEDDLNEQRRRIKIIDPAQIETIKEEYRNIFET